MRLLTTSVTAAVLIAHALLGCCWHHAHAEVTGGATSAATIKPVVHGSHLHGHEDDCNESGESGHHHDSRQGCDEVECTFDSGAPRVQIQSPLTGFDSPVNAPAFLLATGRLDAAYVARTAADGLSRAPIHLLYQVLVI